MIHIGITGQPGFVGSHLYNELGLYPDEFQRIPFEDAYFQSEEQLRAFVRSCDVIVHLDTAVAHRLPISLFCTGVYTCAERSRQDQPFQHLLWIHRSSFPCRMYPHEYGASGSAG
jgi:UDP-2-acetamido-2,6-beta-L-arabino-hexul-4-ose reductase